MRQEIVSFLGKYISASPHLDAMAIAGLPSGAVAPWIFLSMAEVPEGIVPSLPNGGFVPVNGPTLGGEQFAQRLSRPQEDSSWFRGRRKQSQCDYLPERRGAGQCACR